MARYLRLGVAVLACGLALAGCGKKEEPKAAAPVAAKAPAKASARETNTAGVVAEIVEVKRKEGVLTVQLRYTNTGAKAVSFYALTGGKYDSYYVTAEDKKYLMLRDEDKSTLSPQVNPAGDVYVSLQPQGSYLWWAKYPAPPAAVKKVSYHTPVTAPFDDLSIRDE